MSDRTSTVSVIIPCYNAERFIAEAIQSVLSQTHRPCEIIIVDDGSTDQSVQIIRSFGSAVSLIELGKNCGESVARNTGIDAARGEWVAFLDADDIWMPQKLEKQLAVADDDVTAVHTNVRFFGEMDQITTIEQMPEQGRYDLPMSAVENPISATSSSLMVRRCDSPRFPIWTQYAEDTIYCLELFVSKRRIRLVPDVVTGCRVHLRNQSGKSGVEIDWWRSISRWLTEHSDLPPRMFDIVRHEWMERIVRRAAEARRQRRWTEFQILRSYLQTCDDDSSVEAFLKLPHYPKWMYAVRDFGRGLLPKLRTR